MEWCNAILRPFLAFFFKFLYPYIPGHRRVLWFFAKDYFVDGKEGCQGVLQKLVVGRGYGALLNYCSEDAKTLTDVLRYKNVYADFIQEAARRNSGQHPLVALSIKMSQFGCFARDAWLSEKGREMLEETIASAARARVPVVLDAERLDHAEKAAAFGFAMNRRYRNVKIRLQAYNPDFLSLMQRMVGEMALTYTRGSLPLGVCKGAYHEKRALSAAKTRENFLEGVLYCYRAGNPISADTNDPSLIQKIIAATIRRSSVPSLVLSVGMLYNVRPSLARKLRNDGMDVAIYLPVVRYSGNDARDSHWEGFAIRRLVEKPIYIFLPLRTAMTKFLNRQSY